MSWIYLLWTRVGTGDELNATSYVDEVQDMLLIDTRRRFRNRASYTLI